jgi:hypothetical protein
VAEEELSETTRQWLAAQPVTHGPAYVLGRYSQRSIEDIREDKQREERRAALRERAQDRADAARFRGEAIHTHQDLLREHLALSELADAEESRRSSREREKRLEAETVRLQEQLLAAQRQHEREQSRSLSALSKANQLAGRRRRRETPDEYYRSYGQTGYGYGGVRFR